MLMIHIFRLGDAYSLDAQGDFEDEAVCADFSKLMCSA